MFPEIDRKKDDTKSSVLSTQIRWNPMPADFAESIGFHSGPRSKRSRLQHALWSWFSSTLDLLVLISLSSFFLVAFSVIFKQNPELIWLKILASQSVAAMITQAFLFVSWVYFITTRYFLGATLGELTCHIQLGTEKQRSQRSWYLIKVISRETLMVLTGLFVLPLISLFIARDFVGDFLGIRLYSLK